MHLNGWIAQTAKSTQRSSHTLTSHSASSCDTLNWCNAMNSRCSFTTVLTHRGSTGHKVPHTCLSPCVWKHSIIPLAARNLSPVSLQDTHPVWTPLYCVHSRDLGNTTLPWWLNVSHGHMRSNIIAATSNYYQVGLDTICYQWGKPNTAHLQPLMHVYTLSFRNYTSRLLVTLYTQTKKANF